MHFQHTDNWVAGVDQADKMMTNHVIHPRGPLTPTSVRATLDKTYGRGRFEVSDHGTAITVFDNKGFVTKLENSLTKSLTSERKAWLLEKITAYRSRYEGLAP